MTSLEASALLSLYLAARLRYFRSGSEAANQMNKQAAPLSDAEIEALAAYFSGASS